ncbi:MAG: tyrosine-protein phosphatase [Elusimicrobia bacterium]|nr:tyrosine-protein phosphatase [Elusimicrobiota bacterium]
MLPSIFLLAACAWAPRAQAQAPAGPPALEEQLAKARAALRPVYQDEDADDSSFGLNGLEALPNFGQVSAEVFRSGQPNREGLREIRARGARSVLVLRAKVSPEESGEISRLGMSLAHVPMTGIFSPSFESVDHALAALAAPARQPVLVHCRYGKDRTGVVVAAYRVAIQGRPVAEAAAEARRYRCCAPLFKPLEGYLEAYLEHRRAAKR